jgi:hypothetical protein
MHHRSEAAQEIPPNYWIEPPVFAKAGTSIPKEVREANSRAAILLNNHKDTFLKLRLDCLFTQEEIGDAEIQHLNEPERVIPELIQKLDPMKFELLLRNDYSPVLVLPSEIDPSKKKQKGHVRQTGHTLTLNYEGRWIGTMEIQYGLNAEIAINVSTKNAP